MISRRGAVAAEPVIAVSAPAALYASTILDHAPRVLSLMDREVLSPTLGCCDRTYWAWKFVDFPGARFQEALCTLAFLYATPLPDSPYFKSSALLSWIENGLAFWSRIQHRDGSFDEAYPFERSLAATAFTSFYIGEALGFIGRDLPSASDAAAKETLARAGSWLCANDETHGFLSNHLAAAAAASYHVFQLTGDRRCEVRSRYFLDRILQRQSREGWYDEYGGADPGYQTHGSFYLARYAELSGDERVVASLARANAFLAHFVHADGSLGGEYASRNTQTYYPAAFEMLADRDPAAAWIAETMRPSLTTAAAAGIRSVDVYNYFPVLNNLVFAYRARAAGSSNPGAAVEPGREPGLSWFPEAGLARVRTARYDAYVGISKGGVTKIFDRAGRRLVYSDSGYVGRLGNGRIISSQHYQAASPSEVTDQRIELQSRFVMVPKPTMKPGRFLGFRLFSLTFGRIGGLGRWLKARLVKALIYRKDPIDLRLTRRIEFGAEQVTIIDHVIGPDGARVASLTAAPVFTTIHMGSSRYFIANELDEPAAPGRRDEIDIHSDALVRGLSRTKVVTFSGEPR